MGNYPSSSGAVRSRRLVLAVAGSGIAVTVFAWKCGFFQRSSNTDKKPKEMRKEENNSQQETRMIFADLCALMVVIGTLRLWGVYDLSKISTEGISHEQSNDRQFLSSQSTSASIDSNSTNGASQSQDKICDSASSVKKVIKIMTYNLCHPRKESLHARMLALTHLVQQHMPDVVLLQEVTSQMHKILKSSRIWDCYKSIAGGFNCIVFSRLPMSSVASVTFSKGGELLLTKSNGNDLFIATSHLNRSIEKRMCQAKEAIENLHSYPNIIFGGDMNWRDGNDLFPLKPGWIDAWEHIRPHEPGYTFDTEKNPLLKGRKKLRERLDRFLCKLNDFELVDIEVIGKEEVPVAVPCDTGGEVQNPSVINDGVPVWCICQTESHIQWLSSESSLRANM